MTSVVFEAVEVDGSIVDVRCEGGAISHVGSSRSGADVTVRGEGGALLPGLHDHHLHLFALAAARSSVDLARARSAGDLDRAVRDAAVSADGAWVRAVGYHETVHGPLDADRLDELAPGRNVRVQHRTGAMWVLSGEALRTTGFAGVAHPGVEQDAAGRPTGRLFGLDDALHERIGGGRPTLAAVGRELAGYGVTGVTDLTPTEDPATVDALAAEVLAEDFPLHVTVTGDPGLAPTAGAALPRGPVKIVVGDHRLPTLDVLMAAFRTARSAGRNVAVHCVTRVALVLALTAWDEVGAVPGDRVEHGAVIPLDLVTELHRLGLVVVTQPAFVATRGDQYLADVDADDVADLWRCASLLAGDVGVAGSTDAPFGPADPWLAIAAAVERRTSSGRLLGGDERVGAARALAMFLTPLDDPAGTPRHVAVGAAADLCLLDRPLHAALAAPADVNVVATLGRTGRPQQP